MSLGRQTFTHAAVYSVANVLGGLASFLLLPFYAHLFGAEGYGVMALVDTSLGMFTVLLSGGLSMAIIRIYHEEEDPSQKSLSIGTGIRLVWCLGFLLAVVPIVFSQCLGIHFQFVIDIGYMPVYLSLVEVILLAVLRPKLSAITGNQLSSDKIKMPGNLNCCPEDLLYGLRIVSPEIGNCVMIRFETF